MAHIHNAFYSLKTKDITLSAMLETARSMMAAWEMGDEMSYRSLAAANLSMEIPSAS
jgi:hypothetical protein